MERPRITAIDKGALGVDIKIKGSAIDIMALLSAIIENVAEIDEDFALNAITTGIDCSDKKERLYKMLERYINSQKGKSL